MIALSEIQLAAVMTAADKLPAEKRGVFLERVVARLGLLPRFTAAEFADAVRVALQGLIQDKSVA
jgi:hypothetical protein